MGHNFFKEAFSVFLLIFLIPPVYGGTAFYAQTEDDDIYGVGSESKSWEFNSDSIFYHYTQKGFAVVINDLFCYYDDVLSKLSYEKQQTELRKMLKIADENNCKELKHEYYFISALLFPENSPADFSNKRELLNTIVEEASKRNDRVMRMRALKAMFNLSWKKKDYVKAFQQIPHLDKELQLISEEEYPAKGMVYYEIGAAYYSFHDYEKAVSYLQQAVRPIKYFFDTSAIEARNMLGSYYALRENIDSANYYFREAYFISGKIKNRSVLDAISLSNIGYIFLINKDYGRAIEYMEPSMSYLVNEGRYDVASNISLRLADCFMAGNDLKKTKSMIDSAQVYIELGNQEDLMGSFYTIQGKYYARLGNPALSSAYMDSAFIANRAYDNKYNKLNILRAEQSILEAESRAKDEELRLKEIDYNNTLQYLYSLIGFMALLIVIVLVVIYMNKKRKERDISYSDSTDSEKQTVDSDNNLADADKENQSAIEIITQAEDSDILLSNSENESPVVELMVEEQEPPTEEEVLLMEEVTALIEKDEIYKDFDLTLDSLAKKLGVKRNYLSKAINRITGKNFNTYINEYRVKEAMKIMSDKKSDVISIDAIALEVGFSNRISFYQSFKKMTGLSPSEFRTNRSSDESATV